MTIEEIRDFLKDEKNAGEFKLLVKDLGFETPEDIQSLRKNKDELLQEKRQLKKDFEEMKKVLDEIDIDEYNELKNKKSSSSGNDEVAKLQREFKKLSEQFATTLKDKEQIENEYNSNLKEINILSALDEIGFDPKHKELLKSAFLGKAKVETDNGKRSVIIESADGLGLPAKDYFKNFASTDQGKAYLFEPENKGANSRSFSQNSAKAITRKMFDSLNPIEKNQIIKDGVSIVD
jgi:chaperonin cofactor prefoldin